MPAGLEIEADPGQAERLVRQLNVEGANTLSTPGAKAQTSDIKQYKLISDQRSSFYKSAVARENYMALDRPECQLATK